MSEDVRALLSPAAILISVSIGLLAIYVNYRVNGRNRRIRATIDLFNVYYTDVDFVKRRLELWDFLHGRQENMDLR